MRSLLVGVCFLQCVYSDVEMLASVNDTVTLQCKPNAYDPVNWRMRKPLESVSKYVIIGNYVAVNYRAYASLLVFYHYVNLSLHSVSLDDSGIYTCIDKHGAGRRHDPIRLTVVNPSEVTSVVQTTIGNVANLTCEKNSGEYGWWHLRDGGWRDMPDQRGKSLVVSSVQLSNSGLYACGANFTFSLVRLSVLPPTLEPTTSVVSGGAIGSVLFAASCIVAKPTTLKPTTLELTTLEPTTLELTTLEPTTLEPTTLEPTTPTTVHSGSASNSILVITFIALGNVVVKFVVS